MINLISQIEQNSPTFMAYLYIFISGWFSHIALSILKYTSPRINIFQQCQLRALFQIVSNYCLQQYSYNNNPNRHISHISYEPIKLHWFLHLRGILGGLGFIAIQRSIQLLNLTEVYSIIYLSPITTLIGSRLFLGEQFTIFDYLGFLLAMSGALLVIEPPFVKNLINCIYVADNNQIPDINSDYTGYFYVSITLFCYTLVIFIIKQLPKREISVNQILNSFSWYMILFSTMGQLLTQYQVQIIWTDYLMMAVCGCSTTIFQNLDATAIRLIQPGKLMIIKYLGLFYAFLTDLFIFHKSIQLQTAIGSILIFGIAVVMFIKNSYLENKNNTNKL